MSRDAVAVTPAARPRPLRVGGVVPFTTIDYPGALAAVVFCQGCPWRCTYCHNPHLLPARGERELDFGAVLHWLAQRRGLLDAVVFSGGEPTAQAALGPAITAVRAQGYAVGLHTGGAYPRRLARVLDEVDWVGLDFKALPHEYGDLTGVAGSGAVALESLALVRERGVAHEIRTTVHPGLTPPAALERMAEVLAAHAVTRWVLQPLRMPAGASSAAVAAPLPDERLLVRLARHLEVELRR